MKVAAVSAWYPNDVSPSTGVFVEKDVQLLSEDHDVRVIHLVAPAFDDGGPATIVRNGIVVHRIVMSPGNPLQIADASRRIRSATASADLVHTMAFPSLLPLAVRRPEVPWVHTEHWSGLTNPVTLPRSWQVALPVLVRALARPDVVTAVCDYLARPIRAVRSKPTTIVPCIVPPADPLIERPASGNRLRLVSVGGLIDRKDPIMAVRTVAALRDRGVDAGLTWVGDGPLSDLVIAEARNLGVADRIYLAGVRDAAGVAQALGEADIFFLPTKADNFCVSAAEALMSGRPVVVGITGGQAEYVAPEVGALVDRQDPDLYASAIVEVAQRTQKTSAQEIVATIGGAFSPETVRKGYAAAYRLASGGAR